VLPRHAAAVALRATRALALTSAEELAGGALVDALRRANEEMLAALDTDGTERCPPDELAGAYTQFIEEWCRKEDVDAHLVRTDIQIIIFSLLHTWLITNSYFIFWRPGWYTFPYTVTEIVPGRQPACANQISNQEEYTFRGPPRGACPVTHYARAPGTITTSDPITHTKHRKTIHVYDTYGYTCLASAFTGRVGAWHSRFGGRGVDERATRSPEMRRDMAMGRGSV
jgi:hypothetical protein